MRCASFVQPTIEECEAKSKAPTAAEKRDKIMKLLKAGDKMVYHWKAEGWLEADFCESAVEGTNKHHRFTSTSCCSNPIGTALVPNHLKIWITKRSNSS